MSGVRLVGRQRELDALVRALSTRTHVALVGPRGMGRSRLTEELCEFAQQRLGCRVLTVRGSRAASNVPLGVVSGVLDGTAAHESADPDEQAARPIAAAISAAHTTIADRFAGSDLVVVVDDAHLLDDSTVVLLERLAAEDIATLMVTCPAGSFAECELVRAIWKDHDGSVLELARLAPPDVEELVHLYVGGPVEQTTCERLGELVEGNPLQIRELVEQLLASGEMRMQHGLWTWDGRLEPGLRLREVTRDRLGRLSPEEQRAVEALALAQPLPLATLTHLAGPRAVERLEQHRLVRVEPGEQRLVRLASRLDTVVISTGLPASAAACLASEVADALAAAGSFPGQSVKVALLRVAADQPPDAPSLAAAASDALGDGEPDHARRLAEAAVRAGDDGARLVLGEALVLLGRAIEADAALATIEPAGLDDAALTRLVRARIDALAHGLGRVDEASTVVAQTAPLFDDEDLRDRVRALWAFALAVHGRHDETVRMAEDLLTHRDIEVRLTVWPAMNLSFIQRGAAHAAASALEELVSGLGDGSRTGDPLAEADASLPMSLLVDYILAGRLDDADRLSARIADLATPGRRGGSPVYLDVMRAKVALLRGLVVTAERYLRSVLVAHDQMEALAWRGWAVGLLAEACALSGRVSEAEQLAGEAESACATTPVVFVPDVRRAIAWATAARGAPAAAVESLITVADAARATGLPLSALVALHDALRLGATGNVVERILELASEVDTSWAPPIVAHATGVRDGDVDRIAAAALQFADLGALLCAADASSQASALLAAVAPRRAGHLATQAPSWAAACEGASTPMLAAAPETAALTRREREVAALAAGGHSSKKIAAMLSMSPRTVDNLLGRVYSKLGVEGRNQLPGILPPSR